MARSTPPVKEGSLFLYENGQPLRVPVGSAAWWDWLAAQQNTTFSFSANEGSFTARKERKSGGEYWYAYRRRQGHLHKAYIGKPSDLTLARLTEVAVALSGSQDEKKAEQIRPGGTPGQVPAKQIIATKLFMPRARAGLVPRARLTSRLDAGLTGLLTLVSAPPGFGKTTLLGEWLCNSGRPVAWLSLDEGDSDPGHLFLYLIAALRTISPGSGESAMALLQGTQAPPPQVMLSLLVNDLAALPEGSVLVLDDYHVLQAPPAHEAIQFLLDHMPAHLHLVIATREDPPLPLPRLRVRRQLNELRAADLRFTTEEAAAFLRDAMGLNIAEADVERLEERTEGWIAGLQLAALSMQDQADTARFVAAFTGSNRYVLDYLAEEVLSRQTVGVQRFLLYTSILDRICAPLCDALVGPDTTGEALEARSSEQGSQGTLEKLERHNLFLVPLDTERRWYRYHGLFADILQARLVQAEPQKLPELHRRAAAWYEGAGFSDQAIEHALLGADYERASRLALTAVRALPRPTELRTLIRWLEALPDEMLRTRPQLSVDYAWMLSSVGRIGEAEEYLQACEEIQQRNGGDKAENGRILGSAALARCFIASRRADVAECIRQAQRAIALLPQDDLAERGSAALFLAEAYAISGDMEAAARTYAEAEMLSRAAGNDFQIFVTLVTQAGLFSRQGRLSRAEEASRKALRLAGVQALPVLGMARIALGGTMLERNRLAEAEEQITEGIRLLLPIKDWNTNLVSGYAELVRLRLARHDLPGAARALQEAEELPSSPQCPYITRQLELLRVRCWLALRQTAFAEQWLLGYMAGEDPAPPPMRGATLITAARVMLALGRAGDALSLLDGPATAGTSAGMPVLQALTLRAHVLRANGETKKARQTIEEALALAEPEGYLRVFLDEGEPIRALLQDARAHGIAPAMTARLLRLFEIEQAGHSGPNPLSEREISVLRLLAEGLSGPQIAGRLVVSPGTIKTHLKNAYSKLDVHNREQAITRAREAGLI